jgi:hypothetical protein
MLGVRTYSPEIAVRAYRTWVHDGRLIGLPAKRSRRLPLLDLAAQAFEPGETYSAREVDEALARWHPDTAALRRYLVDEGVPRPAPGRVAVVALRWQRRPRPPRARRRP